MEAHSFGTETGRDLSGHFSCAVFRMRKMDARIRRRNWRRSTDGPRQRERGVPPKGEPVNHEASPENVIQFPVAMAGGSHLFPYRTQKLSLHALMVLGW